jgi:hypothetical protein
MKHGTKTKSQAGSVKKATAKKTVASKKREDKGGKGKESSARGKEVAAKTRQKAASTKGGGAPKSSDKKAVVKEPEWTFSSPELDTAFRRVVSRYSGALKRLAE